MNNEVGTLKFIVQNDYDGLKLNQYLRSVVKFSSRFTQKVVRGGGVKVNNVNATLFTKLRAGDAIEVHIEKSEEQDIIPEKMELDVVYEDEDIIVVNKPAGIVVHPTKRYPQGTLANGLLYHFKQNGNNCIVRLVSRLDMDTSGLILVAKNAFSHMSLARDMNKEEFVKSYLAIVHGELPKEKGVIDKPIYKPDDGSIRRIIDNRGQKSITHFNVVERFNNSELVRLVLETGRTHQIRIHLSSMGTPIYGDSLYGKKEDEYIMRQALHAYSLQILHPRSGKLLKFQCELPDDMKELLRKLK
ncbi:RluA family pseudouridine synthase [Clostridium sp. MB40-C1]|uniref:RluA family pseudouridine synthase n=1 Tax=Clostridium sp. MB40-C1 TaxID=3070996 RepID=UPI0027E04C95|nr:RluA family pseudouridine synthase [Clostridium sp. MB40-C1]WMJ82331.1 RluA family pseudouridine synthase [Clostridium sp. MB40-C1]